MMIRNGGFFIKLTEMELSRENKRFLNTSSSKKGMVLEALISPLKAEREPWEMFFLGILYSSIGLLLGLWVFKSQVSLVMVFFTVLASIILFYNTIKYEEKKSYELNTEIKILRQHGRALSFFMFLFFGFV